MTNTDAATRSGNLYVTASEGRSAEPRRPEPGEQRKHGAGRTDDDGGTLAPVPCIKYLVRAQQVYDVDGNNLGCLFEDKSNKPIDASVRKDMQRNPGQVRLLKPNEPLIRTGVTVGPVVLPPEVQPLSQLEPQSAPQPEAQPQPGAQIVSRPDAQKPHGSVVGDVILSYYDVIGEWLVTSDTNSHKTFLQEDDEPFDVNEALASAKLAMQSATDFVTGVAAPLTPAERHQLAHDRAEASLREVEEKKQEIKDGNEQADQIVRAAGEFGLSVARAEYDAYAHPVATAKALYQGAKDFGEIAAGTIVEIDKLPRHLATKVFNETVAAGGRFAAYSAQVAAAHGRSHPELAEQGIQIEKEAFYSKTHQPISSAELQWELNKTSVRPDDYHDPMHNIAHRESFVFAAADAIPKYMDCIVKPAIVAAISYAYSAAVATNPELGVPPIPEMMKAIISAVLSAVFTAVNGLAKDQDVATIISDATRDALMAGLAGFADKAAETALVNVVTPGVQASLVVATLAKLKDSGVGNITPAALEQAEQLAAKQVTKAFAVGAAEVIGGEAGSFAGKIPGIAWQDTKFDGNGPHLDGHKFTGELKSATTSAAINGALGVGGVERGIGAGAKKIGELAGRAAKVIQVSETVVAKGTTVVGKQYGKAAMKKVFGGLFGGKSGPSSKAASPNPGDEAHVANGKNGKP